MTPAERDKHDQFLRLYVEQEESLRGFVRSLVPTLDDAREVMQETAALLWRKFDDLDSPENFRRWAFGVARMEALTFRRDRARDRHVFSEDLIRKLEAEAEVAAGRSDRDEGALESCLKSCALQSTPSSITSRACGALLPWQSFQVRVHSGSRTHPDSSKHFSHEITARPSRPSCRFRIESAKRPGGRAIECG